MTSMQNELNYPLPVLSAVTMNVVMFATHFHVQNNNLKNIEMK